MSGESPSQFEQENDLGRGGGEVDDAMIDEAWRNAEERGGPLDAHDMRIPDDDEADEA